MKRESEFFDEINRLVGESACALRKADPQLLLQASEVLGQIITKWHRSELATHGTVQLTDTLSKLESVIVQLKLQQSLLRQQKAHIEKQLKVLLPAWSNGLYANNLSQRATIHRN